MIVHGQRSQTVGHRVADRAHGDQLTEEDVDDAPHRPGARRRPVAELGSPMVGLAGQHPVSRSLVTTSGDGRTSRPPVPHHAGARPNRSGRRRPASSRGARDQRRLGDPAGADPCPHPPEVARPAAPSRPGSIERRRRRRGVATRPDDGAGPPTAASRSMTTMALECPSPAWCHSVDGGVSPPVRWTGRMPPVASGAMISSRVAAITFFAVVFTLFVVVTARAAGAGRPVHPAAGCGEHGRDGWPNREPPTTTRRAEKPSRASTALVLAGGGTRGAVQIGMLQVLTEHGFVPDRIYGSSVGAVNGVAFAGDPTRAGVERMTADLAGTHPGRRLPPGPTARTLALPPAAGLGLSPTPGCARSSRRGSASSGWRTPSSRSRWWPPR